jgi:uncharacterized membrane protein
MKEIIFKAVFIIVFGTISLWCLDTISTYYRKQALYEAIDESDLTQKQKDAFKWYIEKEY